MSESREMNISSNDENKSVTDQSNVQNEGTNNPPSPKQRKLRSLVWNNMTREKNKDGDWVATCNHCKKKICAKNSSGTTHFKNYLKFCSPHDAEELTRVLKEKVYNWHIDEKIFSLVVDNASTNDAVEASVRLSSTKYPTINIAFVDICSIRMSLTEFCKTLSCILDPRFKMKTVEFFIHKIFVDGYEEDIHISNIKRLLIDL
ncbi:hypothetical protein Taro_017364 [Colocasia esculenta]|uniref:BED-type domain-containing protein n=1 Tax=Colocasia esculenta TaxID=4460 RepID=A0A843UMX0_COLES|nr:hypothetical protein [Colocasia esculenta]